MENDWCLYVIVNTNLNSMNWGKSMAHSGHAANAFIYEQYIMGAVSSPKWDAVKEWMNSTGQGFGTQINLKADDFEDALHVVNWANSYHYPANFVIDPTYPFEVSFEVYNMLQDEFKKGAIIKADKAICFRKETTAVYIFGRRSDKVLSDYLSQFKLHP